MKTMTHFVELNQIEKITFEGGAKVPTWLKITAKGFTALWLAEQIIENWDVIKEGLAEGWNSVGK